MPIIRDDGTDDEIAPGRTGSAGKYDDFLVAARLLQRPRLARIYVYVCYVGSTTIEEIADALALKRATTYEDVEELEAIGAIERDESTRPHRISADAFAYVDPDGIAITPTVLHAIALCEIEDDVEYIYDRYGPGTVAAAVRLAAEYYADGLTERMAARELEVRAVEGMALLGALERVIAAGVRHDPYFDLVAGEYADEIQTSVDASLEQFGSDTDADE